MSPCMKIPCTVQKLKKISSLGIYPCVVLYLLCKTASSYPHVQRCKEDIINVDIVGQFALTQAVLCEYLQVQVETDYEI